MTAHVLMSQANNERRYTMNAQFKVVTQAVAWKQQQEAKGFVVVIEVRGAFIFATARRIAGGKLV